MGKEYISREAVSREIGSVPIRERYYRKAMDIVDTFPAADVVPVRHAYWVKRMEHGVGRGYENHTPIWSCSDCGRDYDPASCSIIKYCYICGAKMDGGADDV